MRTADHQRPESLLVVHHQESTGAAPQPLATVRDSGARTSTREARQIDDEDSSLPYFDSTRQASAMLGQRSSRPWPDRGRCRTRLVVKYGIEDSGKDVSGDAAPVVADGDSDVSSGRLRFLSPRSTTFSARTSMMPPSGIACFALRRILWSTWPIWPASTSAAHRSSAISTLMLTAAPARARWTASTMSLATETHAPDRSAPLAKVSN